MTDVATLRQRLAEAETAHHKLMLGQAVASFSVDGVSETTYTRADIGQLASYIASLRSQIAVLDGQTRSARRPIYLGF